MIPDTGQLVGPLVGLVLASWQFIYRRWEWFFLASNRARFFLTNPSTFWTVQIEAIGHYPAELLEHAEKELRTEWPEFRLLGREPVGVTLLVEGVTVVVRLDSQEETEGGRHFRRFVLEFVEARASYKETDALIERIAMIVRRVDRACRLEQVKYTAIVTFPKENPYFGLYTQRLRSDLISFNAVFEPTLGQTGKAARNTVTVSRDRVSLVTQDVGSWVSLSKKYLAAR